MRFEETIDYLIEQTKEEMKNLPANIKLDLIGIALLADYLEDEVKFIKTIGHAEYTFEALMTDLKDSLKEIEEIYEKKRKELGL